MIKEYILYWKMVWKEAPTWYLKLYWLINTPITFILAMIVTINGGNLETTIKNVPVKEQVKE